MCCIVYVLYIFFATYPLLEQGVSNEFQPAVFMYWRERAASK